MIPADPPTCRCGEPMDVEEGLLVDVVRCSTGECRAEGARGPLLKALLRLGRWSR